MPTISNVSDDEPIATSWGNDVADTLNDECVKWDDTDDRSTSPDGSLWLAGELPTISLVRTSSQSLANATNTLVTYTAEVDRVEFSAITPNVTTTITVPSGCGGLYLVSGHLQFAVDNTGARRLMIQFSNNGSIGDVTFGETAYPSASITCDITVARQMRLQAGANVWMYAFQSTGGSLNVEAAALALTMLQHRP